MIQDKLISCCLFDARRKQNVELTDVDSESKATSTATKTENNNDEPKSVMTKNTNEEQSFPVW